MITYETVEGQEWTVVKFGGSTYRLKGTLTREEALTAVEEMQEFVY